MMKEGRFNRAIKTIPQLFGKKLLLAKIFLAEEQVQENYIVGEEITGDNLGIIRELNLLGIRPLSQHMILQILQNCSPRSEISHSGLFMLAPYPVLSFHTVCFLSNESFQKAMVMFGVGEREEMDKLEITQQIAHFHIQLKSILLISSRNPSLQWLAALLILVQSQLIANSIVGDRIVTANSEFKVLQAH